MKKIVIGLSGGVDSSVCLFLTKMAIRNDFLLEAAFMKNWDSFLNNDMSLKVGEVGCESNKDYFDAIKVCQLFDVNLNKVEFIKEYWNLVFQLMIKKYQQGLTPNPDILCNKYIKFLYFSNYAINELGADLFIMGHYAKKRINDDGSIDLLIPLDKHKDQTYFLCELNQEQLKRVIFPLGDLLKEDVRRIAENINLPNAKKKDSTGICFIGNRNFKNFLANYLPIKKGKIINLDNNEIIGEHDGVWFYTIGQRKKLGLSGMDQRYFVAKKDVENNILYVSSSSNQNQFLYCNIITTQCFNWINKIPTNNNCLLRYRHCGELHEVSFKIKDNQVIIYSKNKLKSVSIGQYAVLYQDDVCLGGGEIVEIN